MGEGLKRAVAAAKATQRQPRRQRRPEIRPDVITVPEVWVNCGNCGDGMSFAPDGELPCCRHCGYDDSWAIDCPNCLDDVALEDWLARFRVLAERTAGAPGDIAATVTCASCARPSAPPDA